MAREWAPELVVLDLKLPLEGLFVLLEQLVSKVAALGQYVEDHAKFPVVKGWSDVPQVQQIILKYEKGS